MIADFCGFPVFSTDFPLETSKKKAKKSDEWNGRALHPAAELSQDQVHRELREATQGLGAVAGEDCQQTAAVLLQQDLRRRVGVKV
jgi:hypothetical protein